jgi:hypothetical protein
MPSLKGFQWNPIVTVLNPTSAMTEEKQADQTEHAESNSSLKRLRGKFRVTKTGHSEKRSANNHT